MVKRSMSDEERRLRDRLKREADAMQPEFSESLHQRVMGAIRQAPAPQRPSRPRSAAWTRRPGGWLSLAAAACLAAALGLVAWHFVFVPAPGPMPPRPDVDQFADQRPPDQPVVPAPQQPPLYDPQLPLVDQTAERLTMLADAALSNPQWAYLDHDASLAGNMLLDHLLLPPDDKRP